MKETLVKVIALLGLVAILGLAACDPTVSTISSTSSTGTNSSSSSTVAATICPSVSVAANEVLVAVDYTKSYVPIATAGVIPFFVGAVSNYLTGAQDWEKCVNGGITSNGTGPQVAKIADGLYYIKFTIADESDYTIEFKPANYSTNAWADTSTNFWGGGVVGAVLIGGDNVMLGVTSNQITMIGRKNNKYYTNVGMTGMNSNGIVIADGNKRIKIDVAAFANTSVAVSGVTTGTVNMTLIVTNVPDMRSGSSLTAGQVWMPLVGVISNTNTGGAAVTNGLQVRLTGNQNFFSTNNDTQWNMGVGVIATVDAVAKTFTYALTIPAGSAKSAEFKSGTISWNYGEMANNGWIQIPASGTVTNYVNFQNESAF